MDAGVSPLAALRPGRAIGVVPTGVAPVRWLPVNIAADILFREVAHAAAQPAPGPVRYYTLDNALAVPWRAVVDALALLAAMLIACVAPSSARPPLRTPPQYRFCARPGPR